MKLGIALVGTAGIAYIMYPFLFLGAHNDPSIPLLLVVLAVIIIVIAMPRRRTSENRRLAKDSD